MNYIGIFRKALDLISLNKITLKPSNEGLYQFSDHKNLFTWTTGSNTEALQSEITFKKFVKNTLIGMTFNFSYF